MSTQKLLPKNSVISDERTECSTCSLIKFLDLLLWCFDFGYRILVEENKLFQLISGFQSVRAAYCLSLLFEKGNGSQLVSYKHVKIIWGQSEPFFYLNVLLLILICIFALQANRNPSANTFCGGILIPAAQTQQAQRELQLCR